MSAPIPESYNVAVGRIALEYAKRIAALEAQNQQLRAALDMMLSSAHPNERDHPAMFCAWKEARAALAATELKETK